MDLAGIMAIKYRLYRVFRCIDTPFPYGAQVEEMMEDVKAGEEALALELFCTQLYEYDMKVPPEALQEIEALGRILGIAPDNWEDLQTTG